MKIWSKNGQRTTQIYVNCLRDFFRQQYGILWRAIWLRPCRALPRASYGFIVRFRGPLASRFNWAMAPWRSYARLRGAIEKRNFSNKQELLTASRDCCAKYDVNVLISHRNFGSGCIRTYQDLLQPTCSYSLLRFCLSRGHSHVRPAHPSGTPSSSPESPSSSLLFGHTTRNHSYQWAPHESSWQSCRRFLWQFLKYSEVCSAGFRGCFKACVARLKETMFTKHMYRVMHL